MKKLSIVLLCLCLLMGISACVEKPEDKTLTVQEALEGTELQPNSQMAVAPQEISPVTGSLETGLLQCVSDLSRCGITSTFGFQEVGFGYYFLGQGLFYYADKSDLANWVPACNKPNCSHTAVGSGVDCNARADKIWVQEERIYKLNGASHPFTLLSTASDGTDLRTEFEFSETTALIKQSGCGTTLITPEYLVCFTSTLNSEGSYDFHVYTASEDGVILHMEEQRENMSVLIDNYNSDNGCWFWGAALVDDSSRRVLYTLRDGELVSVDLTGLPTSGAYFTGEELLAFRSNDGYYRIDTATREEVKLAEPQLTDSYADIALPNCILESTLFSSQRVAEDSALRLFNGENWLDVIIPEEFLQPGNALYLATDVAVASDRLLLQAYDRTETTYRTVRLYQILLTTDTPTLEYLATIG